MNKKQEKSFIKASIIICAITMILIWVVCYLMKNMEWWLLMIAIFIILIFSAVINSLNMVFHIKNK